MKTHLGPNEAHGCKALGPWLRNLKQSKQKNTLCLAPKPETIKTKEYIMLGIRMAIQL